MCFIVQAKKLSSHQIRHEKGIDLIWVFIHTSYTSPSWLASSNGESPHYMSTQSTLLLMLNALLKWRERQWRVDKAPGDSVLYFPPFWSPPRRWQGRATSTTRALFNSSVIFHTFLEATLVSSSGVSADSPGLHTCCDGRFKHKLIKSIVQIICSSLRLTHLQLLQHNFIFRGWLLLSLWCKDLLL